MTPAWARTLLLAAAALALEGVCRAGWVSPVSIIAPSRMVIGTLAVLASPEDLRAIGATLATVAAASLIAAALGFAGGYALHRLPRLRRAADPFLASYYAVPIFVLYPLLIVLFGLNRGALVALGVLFASVAMVLNALAGFDRVPNSLRRTAASLRMSPWRELMRITIPACAPYLCTGMKLVVAYALIGVIAGEFVLAGSGLGHRIAFAYNNFDSGTMYGLILLLIVFVATLNALLQSWETRLYRRWGQ